MAYKQNNTLKKLKFLAQFVNWAKFLRFVFFFYGFISFIFWFLNCLEVDWLYRFTFLFILPVMGVRLFYIPEGVSADFTLAIVGGISLATGFLFDYVLNLTYHRIVYLQDQEEKRIQMQREKRRKKATTQISSHQKQIDDYMEYEVSKLIFLIQPHVNKIKKNETDLELTFQEVELWKQRINKRVLESISYSKPLQKGYYRKNLFLLYKDFNNVDNFLYYIKPTLDSLIMEFKQYEISISFSYVLSSLERMSFLEKELDLMDTILSLGFINDLVVTSKFKNIYENRGTKQYSLSLKGDYNLSKNLTISNKQPLYSLVNLKK